MTHVARARFAFMLTVVIVGLVVVADIVLSFHLEDTLFMPYVVVPIFVVAYLLAPLLNKRIPYK